MPRSMYLRTVFGSRPVRRAIAVVVSPCRCNSRIIISSPSWTIGAASPERGMASMSAQPFSRGAPRLNGWRECQPGNFQSPQSGRITGPMTQAYAAALAADPSLKHIWVQYGHSLKEQGLLDKAEAAYRHSLRLDDAIADTHYQLFDVLLRQGRVGEATAAWEVAVKLAPELMVNPRDTAMREAFDFILAMTQPQIVCDIGSLDGGEAMRFSGVAPEARVFAFEAS